MQRCVDLNGDDDCDGVLEYDSCEMIMPPNTDTPFLMTEIFDEFILGDSYMKYTFYVSYPNNNFWGSAYNAYYYTSFDNECLIGDVSGDTIINVIDIVTLVNHILGSDLSDEGLCAADLNEDGLINVIDIVNLVNIILS
jgi:hypothetical protein